MFENQRILYFPTEMCSCKSSATPSGRDISCLYNFDTFTRTSVRESKMNAIARVIETYVNKPK